MRTDADRVLLGAMPKSMLDSLRKSDDVDVRRLVAEVDRLRRIEHRQGQMLDNAHEALMERRRRDYETKVRLLYYETVDHLWPLPSYLRNPGG